MNSIHFLDWAIISLYFLSLIYIGIIRQKNERQSESGFILSGRKLSLTGFIATLVTTWYGAILCICENTFLYCIQTWFIFSLPYYIFAMMYALWIAPRITSGLPNDFCKSSIAEGEVISICCNFSSNPEVLLSNALTYSISKLPKRSRT